MVANIPTVVGAGGTISVIGGQLVAGAQDKIKIINQEKRPESNSEIRSEEPEPTKC